MSAFLCSDAHINAIVHYAVENKVWFKGGYVDPHEATRLLQRANIKSVVTRYKEHAETATIMYRLPATLFGPAAIARLCACYDYQACEVKDYEKTAAAQFINAVRAALVKHLPMYEAMPWTI